MPFCMKCGTSVTDQDQFCGGCGARQNHAAAGGPSEASGFSASANSGTAAAANGLDSLSPKTAALLCYIPVVGWIASLYVLSSDRFRQDLDTRFHAFQGLYLFVVYLIVDWVLGPMLNFRTMDIQFEKLMKLALLGTWIFLLVKTNEGVMFKLPIIGELADRSVSEQR